MDGWIDRQAKIDRFIFFARGSFCCSHIYQTPIILSCRSLLKEVDHGCKFTFLSSIFHLKSTHLKKQNKTRENMMWGLHERFSLILRMNFLKKWIKTKNSKTCDFQCRLVTLNNFWVWFGLKTGTELNGNSMSQSFFVQSYNSQAPCTHIYPYTAHSPHTHVHPPKIYTQMTTWGQH